jgi:hypothetical protein
MTSVDDRPAEAHSAGAEPLPAVLARWLLAAEAGTTTDPQAFAAAGERAYLRLRAHLAILLGARGFDALWARSISLAQQAFHSAEGSPPAQAASTDAYGLLAAVHGRDLAVTQQVLGIAFANFITLLFTFIGENLGRHLIRQIWPDLPQDMAESRAEKASS